ncbi:sulfopyruvate decarboxylase subunit beta [Methanogenium sp. S4BF]|uniref:sulfopyruvate decarboxylase subunit beta n=1 Tax=Methanogenium sp. S4BF TaxID=1789226 RepID=UPI00241737DC|nr:sulfopyruvate decarboxylase subunit beta [Methanogenium sp. S4BF]WFN34049.1 sulfopyruvate decarboxylase subunit beta [Methanogenium sp. S4BF]
MHEESALRYVASAGVDTVVSLPCDRTQGLYCLIQENFRHITVMREEDGVGLCAGLFLAGNRPMMHIQSSGLGTMLNAIMTLPVPYELPLPVLASWRGVHREKTEVQMPFNIHLPDLLDALDIVYTVVHEAGDLDRIEGAIADAFEHHRPHIILVSPKVWEGIGGTAGVPPAQIFPLRNRDISLAYERTITQPFWRRADAIAAVASLLTDELVVTNLGVPGNELYAVRDRPENFYMMGSYTQATPIGLGLALGQDRDVVVFDGDGSLLGTAILPVVAAEAPANLTIIALDNGSFGSTGDQPTHAYAVADLELLARGAGITNTCKVQDEESIRAAFRSHSSGPRFIHAVIAPGNSKALSIPFRARDIRDRFMGAVWSPAMKQTLFG